MSQTAYERRLPGPFRWLRAGGDPCRPDSRQSTRPAPINILQTRPGRFFHPLARRAARSSGSPRPVSRLHRTRRQPEIPIALDSQPPARLTATSRPGAFGRRPSERAEGPDVAGVPKPAQKRTFTDGASDGSNRPTTRSPCLTREIGYLRR